MGKEGRSGEPVSEADATKKVFVGFLLGMGSHLVWPLLGLPLYRNNRMYLVVFVAAIWIGATQWVYLLPLQLWLRGTNRPFQAKGVLIAGAITVLLNSACWGWFALAGPRIGG